jgi:hypothetical protein
MEEQEPSADVRMPIPLRRKQPARIEFMILPCIAGRAIFVLWVRPVVDPA